ncbi:VOC family protein [Vibrio breoganii]|uniref:VOC family protein n=2 Tax=Vibrio TaxID=662 RepID=A0AAJ5JN95_9VIBR|nr:VOC family protein [Vibrio breoganii]ANO33750.1 hypothetical protein A6E01_11195 [Vibrio breoganii]MDN3717249.1 VOC family protein [Vibrio breoganii]NMO74955.1 VOC family protein [Vibrio breoganii]NMR71887.1 VOC family protein [Vibrio breoganii]OCH73474.1 hypothetical protein A6D95_16060 [Vibrio breoganii]
MSQLTPYLFFSGKCEQALAFYCDVFSGEVVSQQLFSDAPQVIEGAEPHWVMHAEFKCPHFSLMMSDGLKSTERDGPIALSIMLDDMSQQAEIFNALAEEGQVIMPLTDMFWGAHFGQLVDKFGIRWMLHCQNDVGANNQ